MKRLSGRWKHLIICPDRALFHGLTSILVDLTPGSVVTDLRTYPARRALADVVATEKPNLCFLDVGSSWDSAATSMQDVAAVHPSMPVVAISGGNDPDVILRSLRHGASEFLFQPFAVEQVGAALDRLLRKLSGNLPTGEDGKVYCVMPGKSASGASTLACNLAFQFQKRNAKKKVLLADLDPNTGTLSFLLKLKSSYSFVDALSHASQMDADLWRGLVTAHQGVDVILCPENPVESIPIQEAATMLDYSREHYGAVVLDVASPHGDWPETIASLCDMLLLVTTNELPALRSAQRALAYLESNNVDSSKIRLVVNRYDANNGLHQEAIETALNHEILQTLPNDVDAIQKSLIEGKQVQGNTPLGRALAKLADKLEGERKPDAKRQSLLSGLFSVFDGVLHKS